MTELKKYSRRIVSISLTSGLIACLLFIVACGQKAGNSASDNSANGTGPYRKSLNVADQAAAIRTLQTIYSAQAQYMLSHGEEYGTLEQLAQENFLDQRFKSASPVVEGYTFTLKRMPKSDSMPSQYTVNADPKADDTANTSGAQHLYIDSTSNVVHANPGKPATVMDTPLQP
jgi:type II secretory pathway pseudopilin PulG